MLVGVDPRNEMLNRIQFERIAFILCELCILGMGKKKTYKCQDRKKIKDQDQKMKLRTRTRHTLTTSCRLFIGSLDSPPPPPPPPQAEVASYAQKISILRRQYKKVSFVAIVVRTEHIYMISSITGRSLPCLSLPCFWIHHRTATSLFLPLPVSCFWIHELP